MKRTIRIKREIHISVEMSEEQANYIRIFLWNIPDKFYDKIEKIAKLTNPDHILEVKEAIQELCMELEIFPGDKND